MQSVWEEQFKIKSYETDPIGNLRICYLFNYFQEAAGNHAAQLNVGFDEMDKKGFYWVLSRIKIIINEMPHWGDEIKLTTWPKGIDKLFALRDFRITNNSGKELITGTSAWLVVDNQKFRLHKIEELGIPIPDNEGKYAIDEELDKIKIIENIQQQFTYKIKFSDIDFVYHANNTRYPSWIMDCYDPEFHKNNVLESIQINYLEQLRFDDTIEVRFNKTNDTKNHYFDCVKENSNSRVFQAIVSWK